MNSINSRSLQNSIRQTVGLPTKWRYGAIATGVLLTQGLGRLWYSPKALGTVWEKELNSVVYSSSKEEEIISIVLETAVDTGLAFLLHHLSNRYFRPKTPEQALVFAALIGTIQILPQVHGILWGKRRVGGLLVDHAFSVLGIFIKILCIQYIPY